MPGMVNQTKLFEGLDAIERAQTKPDKLKEFDLLIDFICKLFKIPTPSPKEATEIKAKFSVEKYI